MDSQVTAALLGGVVGAVAVGFVNYFDRTTKERNDSTSAFHLFQYFHSKCMKIEGNSGAAIEVELLGRTWENVKAFVLENGNIDLRKSVLEYDIQLNELIESERSTPGSSHYIYSRMKDLFNTCCSELTNKGLISQFN